MDYQRIIDTIFEEVKPLRGVGEQATYIPVLAKVNPEQTGICIETLENSIYHAGDYDVRFSLQSITKGV